MDRIIYVSYNRDNKDESLIDSLNEFSNTCKIEHSFFLRPYFKDNKFSLLIVDHCNGSHIDELIKFSKKNINTPVIMTKNEFPNYLEKNAKYSNVFNLDKGRLITYILADFNELKKEIKRLNPSLQDL